MVMKYDFILNLMVKLFKSLYKVMKILLLSVITYKHDLSLQPFSQNVVYFILLVAEPTVLSRLQMTDFLRSFSRQFYLLSESFCQKSAERKSPKKYFLYFVLMSGLGLEPWLYV